MKFSYSCNGSPRGCAGKSYGGCNWHYDRETPARRAAIVDQARAVQHGFKAECDQAEDDSEKGRYAIPEAWKMFHAIDALIRLYEEVKE